MITFLRRKKLGAGSLQGMTAYLNGTENTTGVSVVNSRGEAASIIRNDKITSGQDLLNSSDLVVRWGCTAPLGIPLEKQVNPSSAIKLVGDKLGCRLLLREMDPTLIPDTIVTGETNFGEGPRVLRPRHHAQGRNLFVVNGMQELLNVVRSKPRVFSGGWYASELVNKVAEYRVYVVSGRVATVARKTPDDETQVAWNVAQGGRFDVVRWGDWPLEACRVAIEAFKHVPNLDFSGVDVMVSSGRSQHDENGMAYVIELNSAPSLPLLSDGSVSYRQKCMAKCFKWMEEHGKERMDYNVNQGWRGYIHPAIQEYE